MRARILRNRSIFYRTKASVILFDRQIAFLDQLSVNVRLATGASVKRAEILRALVSFLEKAKVKPDEIESEKGLTDLLVRRLKR